MVAGGGGGGTSGGGGGGVIYQTGVTLPASPRNVVVGAVVMHRKSRRPNTCRHTR